MSQTELSRRTNIHRTTISKMESDPDAGLNFELVARVSKALNVSLDYLAFGGDEDDADPIVKRVLKALLKKLKQIFDGLNL